MNRRQTDSLARFEELLPRAFYIFTAIALLAALVGSTGVAWLFLLLGSAAHVARVGFEGGPVPPDAEH